MVETSVLLEVGLILGIATIFTLIGRRIRQPTIIAYLITGIIAGPMFLDILHSADFIEFFSHMGITFLLFVVGLSLDFRVFRQIGFVGITIGIAQALITSVAGFIIAIKIGLSIIPAFYLAAALAFSSTVVVINLLTEKKELETLHGKIALGILIVQDFIAAAILMILPIIGKAFDSAEVFLIGEQLIKGAFLITGVFVLSRFMIPKVLTSAAKNQEVLFLFSIAWAILIATLFGALGLSLEVGALIAGMSLASSKFSFEIGGKVRGLREFFVIMHLVFFGSLLVGPIDGRMILHASIFSLLVVIGNPLIIMTFMKFFGYKKRTGFLTGISIAQISEFSLILVFLGFVSGVLSQQVLSLTILIALSTIALSTYSIFYSSQLYRLFSPALNIFDGKGKETKPKIGVAKYDIVLIGYNRIGFNLLKAFRKSGMKYLVVDYNPQMISNLKEMGVPCIYGDAKDLEFLEELNLSNSKIIISTIPDLETNMIILGSIKSNKTMFIPTSHEIMNTEKLYRAGADYVIMPHFLGGEYIASLVSRRVLEKGMLLDEKRKQLADLSERKKMGQQHPRKDFHGA